MSFLSKELAWLERAHLRRSLRVQKDCPGRYIRVEGHKLLNFSSNNYLGLAGHPEMIRASNESLKYGTGSTASRLVTGNFELHEGLETRVARFHKLPAARLFGSGYQANIGLLSALAGPRDLIISDRLNHASIIDGIRLSGAVCRISTHLSVSSVASLLEDSASFRRRFVVTDSVFSMDGDYANLSSLRKICDDHDAFLIVDEAHAVGCLGSGFGLCHDLQITPDALVAGFGKSLGSYGGYVAGSSDLCEILLNRARSFVFSTALPSAIVGANIRAIDLVVGQVGIERRNQLRCRIEQMRVGLEVLNMLSPNSGESAIFPILVGTPQRTVALAEFLVARGVFCQAIRPPTVEKGRGRLRVTLSALHTEDDVAMLLAVLAMAANCSTWNGVSWNRT